MINIAIMTCFLSKWKFVLKLGAETMLQNWYCRTVYFRIWLFLTALLILVFGQWQLV